MTCQDKFIDWCYLCVSYSGGKREHEYCEECKLVPNCFEMDDYA